jgi:diketogulonate reductase-like aldo/keto reductase
LDELTGITDTVANVLTGSVVINYDPRIISSEDILSHLAGYRYIDKAKAISSQEYVERAISQASQTASRALLGLAVEKTFEGSSLALLAALI